MTSISSAAWPWYVSAAPRATLRDFPDRVETQAKAAIPLLRQTGGRIVVVSSGAANGSYVSWGAYGSSKAAVNHLVGTLAVEEPTISSVAVSPGRTDTAMQAELRELGGGVMSPEVHQGFVQAFEQGLLHKPELPARVIAQLSVAATTELSGKYIAFVARSRYSEASSADAGAGGTRLNWLRFESEEAQTCSPSLVSMVQQKSRQRAEQGGGMGLQSKDEKALDLFHMYCFGISMEYQVLHHKPIERPKKSTPYLQHWAGLTFGAVRPARQLRGRATRSVGRSECKPLFRHARPALDSKNKLSWEWRGRCSKWTPGTWYL